MFKQICKLRDSEIYLKNNIILPIHKDSTKYRVLGLNLKTNMKLVGKLIQEDKVGKKLKKSNRWNQRICSKIKMNMLKSNN